LTYRRRMTVTETVDVATPPAPCTSTEGPDHAMPGPRPRPATPEEAAPVLEQLQDLGTQRRRWFTARKEDTDAVRAQILDDICAAVTAAHALNIGREKIAKALGVSRQQVNNYLHGHTGKKARP
jgi:hypothetical protein